MTQYTFTADTDYSTVGFVDDDTFVINFPFTLTITTSTVDFRPTRALAGSVLIRNTSTTTPIVTKWGTSTSPNTDRLFLFSNAANDVKAEGEFIQIGTGTGTAGQVVTLPTTDLGDNCPILPCVWVEQGDTLLDGTAVARPYIYQPDTSTSLGPEYMREVYEQDLTANTLTFKTAIPAGAVIKMANIFIIPADGFTGTFLRWDRTASNGTMHKAYMTSNPTTAATFQWYGRDWAGINWDHCGLGLGTTTEMFGGRGAASITNSVFLSGGTSLSAPGAHHVTNCWWDSGCSISGMGVECYVEKARATSHRAVPGNVSTNGFSLTDAVAKDLHVGFRGAMLRLSGVCVVDGVKWQTGIRTDDTWYNTNGLFLFDGAGSTMRNAYQYPLSGGTFTTLGSVYNIRFNTDNCLVNGFSWDSTGHGSNTRYVVQCRSNNCRVNNVQDASTTYVPKLLFHVEGFGNALSNITLSGASRTIDTSGGTIGPGGKLFQVDASRDSALGQAGGIIDRHATLQYKKAAITNKDEGTLYFVPTGNARESYAEETSVSGLYVNNQAGGSYMDTANDFVTFRYPDAFYNITGFTGVAWTYAPNYDAKVRMSRKGGSFTPFTDVTVADLNTALASLPASATNELILEWQVTRLANGLAVFGGMALDVDLSGSDHPFSESVGVGLITGIVPGSRLQVYNETTSTEIENSIVTGTSFQFEYDEGSTITSGDTLRIRLAEQSGVTAKGEFATAAIAGANGFSVLALQTDDLVYNGFGVDGSTLTQFTADYVNDEVDITVASDFNLSDLYAWWIYNLTTEDGMREFFGGIEAKDQANFQIKSSLISAYVDNTTSTAIKQLDNRRIYREDLAYPVKMPTSGGGGVDVVWRNTILIPEGGGGADPAEVATAVWAAATSANDYSGSFGRMTQQTHLSATRAGSLYQEEEE